MVGFRHFSQDKPVLLDGLPYCFVFSYASPSMNKITGLSAGSSGRLAAAIVLVQFPIRLQAIAMSASAPHPWIGLDEAR
jgi:hypothetical protein